MEEDSSPMCLQCVVDAKCVIKDFIPPYHLYVSQKDDEEWPIGEYGLVVINDPDVIFPSNLDDPDMGSYFYLDPFRGHRLWNACIKSGYDPDKHKDGYWVYSWIIERIRNDMENYITKEK